MESEASVRLMDSSESPNDLKFAALWDYVCELDEDVIFWQVVSVLQAILLVLFALT